MADSRAFTECCGLNAGAPSGTLSRFTLPSLAASHLCRLTRAERDDESVAGDDQKHGSVFGLLGDIQVRKKQRLMIPVVTHRDTHARGCSMPDTCSHMALAPESCRPACSGGGRRQQQSHGRRSYNVGVGGTARQAIARHRRQKANHVDIPGVLWRSVPARRRVLCGSLRQHANLVRFHSASASVLSECARSSRDAFTPARTHTLNARCR
jgi:hypothetical protein